MSTTPHRRLQSTLCAFLLLLSVATAPLPPSSRFQGELLTPPYTWRQMFRYKAGTEKGACNRYRRARLDQYWEEAFTLLNSAIDAITDLVEGSKLALSYFEGYFGIKDVHDPLIDDISAFLTTMQDYMFGDDEEWAREKPYLYCDSTYMETHSRTEEALNSAEAPLVVHLDGTEHNPTVENCPSYRDVLFHPEGEPNLEVQVIWMPDVGFYRFARPGEGPEICSKGVGLLGFVVDEEDVKFLTVCPLGFTHQQYPRFLGEKKPRIGHHISELVPIGNVLYHEMYHLSCGGDNTPDSTYRWDEGYMALRLRPDAVPATIKMQDPLLQGKPNDDHLTNKQILARNPQTYVFFSVAYWAFQQTGHSWAEGWGAHWPRTGGIGPGYPP